MSELERLINYFCYKSKIHICIHDILGILSIEDLHLNFKNHIHSTAYCDVAKSSSKGYELCIRCKMHSNRKAILERKPFYGICPYGMLEFVYPVILENDVGCIIYIGNIMPKQEVYLQQINKTCRFTGVSVNELKEQTAFCETDCNTDYYMRTAEILSREIRRLWHLSDKKKALRRSSIISNVEDYISYHYMQDITLRRIAQLHFMNEKYLGRLFLKETGKTFRQYLNDVRMKQALRMLEEKGMSVLRISMDCGYSNVTYFNRVFKQKFNCSPSDYRRLLTQNE